MATDPRVETLALLRRIAVAVERLAGMSNGSAAGDIAPDSELDSQYGDEKVKFDPKDWTGDSCKGLTMSACPAEYLELLAKSFDYFAKKNDESNALTDKGKPKSDYDRRSARRARGWAKRNRSKPAQQPVEAGGGFTDDSEWPENTDAGWQ